MYSEQKLLEIKFFRRAFWITQIIEQKKRVSEDTLLNIH